MPLYEYVCKSCGERFEVRQKFADEPLKRHEECGGDAERLLSAPAFQFKGTGWYVTDYAKSGSGKSMENGATDKKSDARDGKSEGKGESKSESKSESGPAPKTETKSESKSTAQSKPA
jgi:putative FmdB family regulatory protein